MATDRQNSASTTSKNYTMHNASQQARSDIDYAAGMEAYLSDSMGTNMDKLRNFPKFAPRQALSLFLAKHEVFLRILNIHGNIIECGVHLGGGLMTWAKLSAIYEPVNHTRRVIGFDTFSGFAGISEKDEGVDWDCKVKGGLGVDSYEDIQQSLALFDQNRPIGHIPRAELVKGDACRTIPEYIESNKHLVVAMLYLDFDVYEPTKVALETFLPRMPRGAIIVFDQLNDEVWPGETLAVLETVGLRNLRIQRNPITSQFSYAVLE
jgi:hypothetical protein